MVQKRILVCGPMSNYIDYNCYAFDDRATMLRSHGYEVKTPVEMDRERGFFPEKGEEAPEGFAKGALLRNLEVIWAWATVIDLLPWWSFSPGANLERDYGIYCDCEIWYPATPSPAEEAERLVNGPKAEAYGDPIEFWTATAKRWSQIADVDLTPVQAVNMMVAMKEQRLEFRDSRNDVVDREGYRLIGRKFAERMPM